MRRIRRHLLQERGLDAATIVTRGYWKRGEVNHTDHDYGTDSSCRHVVAARVPIHPSGEHTFQLL